jgi:hypothetical protein
VSSAVAGFVRFCFRLLGEAARVVLGKVLPARLLWTLSAATAGLVAFGCSSPTANLEISAPSNAVVGSPFSVTVTAMVDGRKNTIFSSPIHFSSSDSAAVLPADYAFTAADAGSHIFTNGVTLMTAGSQNITVTDNIAPSLNATANVTVTAVLVTAVLSGINNANLSVVRNEVSTGRFLFRRAMRERVHIPSRPVLTPSNLKGEKGKRWSQRPPSRENVLDWDSDQIISALTQVSSSHLSCVRIVRPFVAGRGGARGR